MNVVDWLLDSDAAIRWQTMRDLTDASEDVLRWYQRTTDDGSRANA
jgi:hypothetical protein